MVNLVEVLQERERREKEGEMSRGAESGLKEVKRELVAVRKELKAVRGELLAMTEQVKQPTRPKN